MPARTPQDARLATALLLLGCVGLVASGLGLFPAVPAWAWLAVLALGWMHPLARQRSGARRFDRAERRRNEKARRNLRIARRRLLREVAALSRRVDERLAFTLTPEQVKQLVDQHNGIATDMEEMKRHVAKLLAERNAAKFGSTFTGSGEEEI